MKKALVLLFWLVLCFSCSSKKALVKESVIESVTETLHDTVFLIEADTSLYRAYLECLDGKVVIKEVIESKPGKNLEVPKAKIDGNILQVDCEARAHELFAQWKSKHTSKTITKQVPVYIKTPLTFWQELQIWCGRIMLLIFLGLIIAVIIQLINWLKGRKS